MEIPVRMTKPLTERAKRESQIGLFRLGHATSLFRVAGVAPPRPNSALPPAEHSSHLIIPDHAIAAEAIAV